MLYYIHTNNGERQLITSVADAVDLEKEFGHWGEHPDFPVCDWQDEVASDETRLGYWIWVEVKLADGDEGEW